MHSRHHHRHRHRSPPPRTAHRPDRSRPARRPLTDRSAASDGIAGWESRRRGERILGPALAESPWMASSHPAGKQSQSATESLKAHRCRDLGTIRSQRGERLSGHLITRLGCSISYNSRPESFPHDLHYRQGLAFRAIPPCGNLPTVRQRHRRSSRCRRLVSDSMGGMTVIWISIARPCTSLAHLDSSVSYPRQGTDMTDVDLAVSRAGSGLMRMNAAD